MVVNEKAFHGLDEKTQKVLLEAARKANERGWQMSVKDTEKGLQELKQNGMKGIDPSADLMEGLKGVGKDMTKEWLDKTGKTGKEMINTYSNSL